MSCIGLGRSLWALIKRVASRMAQEACAFRRGSRHCLSRSRFRSLRLFAFSVFGAGLPETHPLPTDERTSAEDRGTAPCCAQSAEERGGEEESDDRSGVAGEDAAGARRRGGLRLVRQRPQAVPGRLRG